MLKSSVIFTALVMAFVLFFLGLGIFHYEYRWQIMRFPLAIGLAIVLFCVLSIVAQLKEARAGGGAEDVSEDDLPPRMDFGRDVTGMLWMLAIVPTIFLFGYIAGLPLYVFGYLRSHGQGWAASAIYALATLAVVYLGFYKLLVVPLPVMPFEFR